MIKFKTISWTNFLAFGNYITEIKIDNEHITLFIGENGAGKSTFLDALMFVLYGKPYRDINKPLLLNTVTNKGLLVTIKFEQNGNEYIINRGMKPNIFEIFKNGELIPQDSKSLDYQDMLETNILRCGAKTFSQVVILGSGNYTPFLSLLLADRRRIIENILDLEIYTVMNSILKGKIEVNKTEIRTEETNKRFCIEKIKIMEENAVRVSFSKETDIKAWMQKIDELTEEGLKVKEKYLEEKSKGIVNYTTSLVDYKNDKFKQLNKTMEYNNKIDSLQKEIDFYLKNVTCEECGQPIDIGFRDNIVLEKENEILKFSAEYEKESGNLTRIMLIIEDLEEKQKEYVKSTNIKDDYKEEMKSLASQIKVFKAMIDKKLKENDVVDTSGLNEEKEYLQIINENLEEMYRDREIYEVLSRVLKDDGIKAIEIEKYIDQINELINKYLLEMNFPCLFYLDTEFNEIIKSRYRDTFVYNSFSEGQKKRINLAILFAWMEIASKKNSVSTNLLIFDEILDTSLDDAGKEDFISLLRKLMQEKSIFIISHNDKFISMASNTVEVKMIGGFSRYFSSAHK